MQRVLRRFGEDPGLLERGPAEVIDSRAAGLIDGDQMMDQLLNWTFSFGAVVRVAGAATDAYATGDWDDVEMAFFRGLLDEQEFQLLAERHLKDR
ncbi:hypothetical protein [Mycolicibacterium fortuitum]|uniref:hypothetical protein n=1 Tax=Mycolicibacterium fortuitum TaxID=1766 RepID=UPI001F3DFD44|nr:hypothetical protein [Mycolicibacterium fortuitum]